MAFKVGHRGLLTPPPCSIFSKARSRKRPGYPVPLRGATVPNLHGFGNLTGADKERLRIRTLCALRCAQAGRQAQDRGVP